MHCIAIQGSKKVPTVHNLSVGEGGASANQVRNPAKHYQFWAKGSLEESSNIVYYAPQNPEVS